MSKRNGTLLKLTAFRLSQQSLERLDEIVAYNIKEALKDWWKPTENRSTCLRRLIDDQFEKIMAIKAAAATPIEKPKTKTPRPKEKGKRPCKSKIS